MPITLPQENAHSYAIVAADTDNQPLSSIGESKIIELYKRYGAILFRGYDIEATTFADFADRFCTHCVPNIQPDRQVINEDRGIYSVDLTPAPFPLHSEHAMHPWKPDICFFGCLNSPSIGGETIICDGTSIVENMAPEVLRAFQGRQLLYHVRCGPKLLKYWFGSPTPSDEALQNPPKDCPYSFKKIDGAIFQFRLEPALYKPMFSENFAFNNFLLFARYMLRRNHNPLFGNGQVIPDQLAASVKQISDKLSSTIPWQKNDVIMFDNTRFMHGRNMISDPKERRIISYFGYLKFAEHRQEVVKDAPWRKPGWIPYDRLF